ncbi:MAG: heme-binding protein [Candidatus Hydrogenedentota bacterium]|nr:MAG: heme-binding protein [Candidatus Hydrogenedentota bacterium]
MPKKIILAIVGVFLIIQLIPVDRNNPPVSEEWNPDREIKQIIQKSCYDCHSNKTKWPWYSYVAPVSWLVAHDVKEGREELNFTEMDRYSERRFKRKLRHALEEVYEKEMPLPIYVLMHPEAKVTDEEFTKLKNYLEKEYKIEWSPENEDHEEE